MKKNKWKLPDKFVMDLGVFKAVTDLAKFGIGNEAIKRRVKGVTDSQITYRCKAYKEGMGMDEGLRRSWGHGLHPHLDMIVSDLAGIDALEFERRMLPRFTPKVRAFSDHKPPKAPTVDEAVRMMKAKKAGMP